MVHCLFLNAAEPSDCGCPGSEPCSLPPSVLPYFRQWPSSHLFTDGSCKLGSLLPPLLPCTFSNPCHLRCALVFSSIAYSAFFWVGGSVCPGGLCWFILGVAEGHCVTLGTHLFGLLKVSQAHLEPVAASSGMGVAARLFSQCFMAWRRCSWARGSECQSFNSPWCFTSTKYGSSISARYLIHRSHAVCICVPVAILDPPHVISYVVIWCGIWLEKKATLCNSHFAKLSFFGKGYSLKFPFSTKIIYQFIKQVILNLFSIKRNKKTLKLLKEYEIQSNFTFNVYLHYCT
jgi:hypothetical protein